MSGKEYGYNFRAPRVDTHKFSMVPRSNVPRSSFMMESQHKTTINASYLYPVFLQEVLPGDSFNVEMHAVVRLATPLFPLMDQVSLESFFFFVPNRLIWKHWYEFCGQEDTPGNSIAFSIPQVVSPAGGFAQFSIFDYFGLPCTGQVAGGNTVSVSALPFRAYNLIYNEWFRDENLVASSVVGAGGGFGVAGGTGIGNMDDGPDPIGNYVLLQAAKKHDYFTSCLPWTQKGTAGAISFPLAGMATVRTNSTELLSGAATAMFIRSISGAVPPANSGIQAGVAGAAPQPISYNSNTTGTHSADIYPTNLFADLTTAVGSTINAVRLAFQTQKLLERDARGGTRYTEIVRSHFGVMSPDMRLMRPEYLGGGKSPVNVVPVPQTTATGLTGGSSPLGTLAAVGLGTMRHGFRYSATEHGYIIGLVCARREQVYQQGIRKLWFRLTRYDFYWPVFAMLGEQAVFNKEIFSDGSANDGGTFGYQERWAEYRYHPSYTSGYFKSTNATPLDAWHLAEKFSSLPALNGTFIVDETNIVLQRALAAGASSNNQQLLCDFFFRERVARPMPMYSVPGMIDHF